MDEACKVGALILIEISIVWLRARTEGYSGRKLIDKKDRGPNTKGDAIKSQPS